MKHIIIAAIALAAFGVQANTIPGTITDQGSFNGLNIGYEALTLPYDLAILQGQPWWGSKSIADEYSTAVASQRTDQYGKLAADFGPTFVYAVTADNTHPGYGIAYFEHWDVGGGGIDSRSFQFTLNGVRDFNGIGGPLNLAVSHVPEVTSTAWLLALGCLGLFLTHRKMVRDLRNRL